LSFALAKIINTIFWQVVAIEVGRNFAFLQYACHPLSISSLSFKAGELKLGKQAPYINAKKITYQIFELLLRS